jgi:DNA (cytosine-5)-methyltransferase 1
VLANAPPPRGFIGEPNLTVEMAAVIQGFPEDWLLAGKKTAQYRQIGNAFPPPVAEAVGKQIAAALTEATAEQQRRRTASAKARASA